MMLRFAVIFLLVGAELCASKNPANRVAQELLVHKLRTLRIPDIHRNLQHRLSISLSNIRFHSISNPTNRVSLRPHGSGLTWTLSNLGISANANYRAVKGGW
ncbi:hypothetical protein RRG08_061803 [Elysia crispata]|uniref:Uncharacterized protein n=1 Tax=Elysia crispata TaxID=231223 RepID=A0AAE1AQP2_9GAST|nr:hypothetical protein RRG08_061803 [Elysia crispata]